MRRRRSLEHGGGGESIPLNTSSKNTNAVFNAQNISTIGIIISLILATILNRHVYNLHIGDKGSIIPLRVGDFIDVRLPILSGSRHVDDTICSGRILSSNISSFLVLISGHALEGAQWMPRERVFRSQTITSPTSKCTLSNAAISSITSPDKCSRFMFKFCRKEWEKHPRTRQFSSFDCRYPIMSNNETDISFSPWYLAQSIGKSRGLCTDPSTILWPPSKITYPDCSKTIMKYSLENKILLEPHFKFPEDYNDDHLFQLQKRSYHHDDNLCPQPELFRWTPDAVLWPDCDRWIRNKCTNGSPCSLVDERHKWSSELTQRSFADAQNWCAGRGKCPSSLEGRWRPGPLFYPDCSHHMSSWCHDRDAMDECHQPEQWDTSNRIGPRTELPKRVQAQIWAHTEMRACPDPFTEFVWNWEL